MSRVVRFFAAGKPATKGSTRSFVNQKTGKAVTRGDCARTKTWQGVVATAAVEAGVSPAPKGRAVSLRVTFYMARPKSHYGTGRNAARLKDSAPRAHTTKPDADKLLRALKDGLTGIAYHDDSQVDRLEVSKVYVSQTQALQGAAVEVRS